MTDQRGGSAVAVVVIILLLAALGGAGFFIYKKKQSESLPQFTTFEHINLNSEVVVFLFQSVPDLYSAAVSLNNELTLIAAEIERINALARQYPSEQRIIDSERSGWQKLQQKLNRSAQALKEEADSYYVTSMVNTQKGEALINESLDGLLADIDLVLEESGKETVRIETESNQTLVDRIKSMLNL